MSLESKFSGKCKFCHASWNAGDKIHKNPGWTNWCSNENCIQNNEPPKTDDSIITATSTIEAVSDEYKSVHDEVWEFALSKAEKIYPNKHDTTQKMILAQVFYKKCFDCKIHGVKA